MTQDDVLDDRTKDGIVRWCKKRSAGASTVISDPAALEALIQSSKVLVVGYFASQSGAEYDAFNGAALSRGGRKFEFITVLDPALHTAKGVSAPSVVVYRLFDEPQVVLAAQPSAEELTEAIARNSIPTVVDFSENTTDDIFGNRLPKVPPTPACHHLRAITCQ